MSRLGNYHDINVQSDTLQFCNVFQNFRNMYSKLDPTYLYLEPRFLWAVTLKIIEINLELLTDID